jgi:hypothetical protein
MSRRQERQRFIRHYKEVTGEREIDMHKVADFCEGDGLQNAHTAIRRRIASQAVRR